jgi:hypothetical protein
MSRGVKHAVLQGRILHVVTVVRRVWERDDILLNRF